MKKKKATAMAISLGMLLIFQLIHAQTYDYKTIPPKHKYTKDEFERLIISEAREYIIGLFGNPSSIQAFPGEYIWYYNGRHGVVHDSITGKIFLVYDPITEKIFDRIQIIFKYHKVRVGALSTKEDYFAVRINYY